MNFSTRISIPANTTKAGAVETELKLIQGEITKVFIFFPDGHNGLTHCQIFDGEIQIFPTNLGEDYSGASIDFNTRYKISKPWELKIKSWNTDDTFLHNIIIRTTLNTKEPVTKETIIERRREGFLGQIINFLRKTFT